MPKAKPKTTARKSHYETLGVSKDATPDQIKQARRKKAAQAHPDKGGSADEMAAVNRAYETLIDPVKRLTYDRTGQDSGPARTIDQEIVPIIIEAFRDVLLKDVKRGAIQHCRNLVAAKIESVETDQLKASVSREKLQSKRDKISVKSGENLFHHLVDQELGKIDQAMEQMARVLKVFKAAYGERWNPQK